MEKILKTLVGFSTVAIIISVIYIIGYFVPDTPSHLNPFEKGSAILIISFFGFFVLGFIVFGAYFLGDWVSKILKNTLRYKNR